ncbi:MAG: hypothetical protein IKB08_06825 [Clostridia bacterium]|nr:hypothetical protein [Clostridia bacterium]
MKENIFIRKIPLPCGVRAFTVPDEQGDYNIYINDRLTLEQQYRSLSHEVSHIEREDFLKESDALVIEAGRGMKNTGDQ